MEIYEYLYSHCTKDFKVKKSLQYHSNPNVVDGTHDKKVCVCVGGGGVTWISCNY